jgi:hypothetical protein
LLAGEQRIYAAGIAAAHDAAVSSITGTQDGLVLFDSGRGTLSFKESLARNLALSAVDLVPLPNTLLADPVKIVGLYFLGDDKAPKDSQGKPEYPYPFTISATYRGQAIQVNETIYGPSVVSIIEYTHNITMPTGKTKGYKKVTYRYFPEGF